MGLAIASVYILKNKYGEQVDRVLSIAISVIQDIKSFCCCPLIKIAQR